MTSQFDDSSQQLLPETPPNPRETEPEKKIEWKTPRKPLNSWRLWVPILFQLILIVAVPAQSIYTYFTGRTVILQTAPVDPYDWLRGYSQTLSYEISRRETLEKLPGGQEVFQTSQSIETFYLVLEAPQPVQNSPRPQPWKPIKVSKSRPKNLPANQVALQGKNYGWSIEYGLETYYMPEDQRDSINEDIRQAQQLQPGQNRQPQPFVVEIKVDEKGHAVPISLWVKEQNYRF